MKCHRYLPAIAVLAACNTATDQPNAGTLAPAFDAAPAAAVGQVYTMTNDAGGNAVLAFDRAASGALTPAGSHPTMGAGTGGGLGNQNAVILTGNGRNLLVVNAGSNDVTSFGVGYDGSLEREGTWPSGGVRPVSITEHNGLVYVLNAGGTGNITGFTLRRGRLAMIAGSSRPLSSPAAGAAQVQFARGGQLLVVTEKATNAIGTYVVGAGGLATGPNVFASNGQTPFGFGVRGGLVVVSEAFGGAPDASAVSSYEVDRYGALQVVSASVGTTETAACWIAITPSGRFAYTTNTASGTISGYALAQGRLTLLDADGVTASTGAGSGPIDLALSRDGAFIYSLNAGTHAIAAFAVGSAGDLTALAGGASGLPAGANGLAAR